MSTFGEVIPIASRRRAPAPELAPPRAPPAPRARGGGVGALLGIVLTIVGVGGLGVLYETRAGASVARLSSPERAAIFERTRDDLSKTCRLPEAADGPLREHCVAGANFLLLFPECDADCGRLARALLPQARK